MRFAMPITIIEPFPTHVIAPQRIDVVESIKFCCCGDKGTVAVHSTADKTAYLPGEIARVTCDVNNTSSGQTVTAIRVNLRRYTHRRSLAAQNVPRSSMMRWGGWKIENFSFTSTLHCYAVGVLASLTIFIYSYIFFILAPSGLYPPLVSI